MAVNPLSSALQVIRPALPSAEDKSLPSRTLSLSTSGGPNSSQVTPKLVCNERELSATIEDEIKQGFFELKQKFHDSGPSSIYISHIILHQKHPVFKKLEIDTVK